MSNDKLLKTSRVFVTNPTTQMDVSGSMIGVTVADGADVALGAQSDAAASSDAGTFSLIALFKRLLGKLTTGISVTQGTSPWVTNDPGLPNSLGQGLMAASTSIAIASDQTAVPVFGSVTVTPSGTQDVNLTKVNGTAQTASDWTPLFTFLSRIPTNPSTDRTTAVAPFSVELSDGAAFYVGAKTGQLPAALAGSGALKVDQQSALPAGGNVIGGVTQSGTWTVTGPLTDTQLRATPPEVADADMMLTVPNAVTVGVADSTIIAAGTTGERDIVISVPTTADTGIYVNAGAAATTSKFLVQAGGRLFLNTNQAIHALRAGAADVTAYIITAVPA